MQIQLDPLGQRVDVRSTETATAKKRIKLNTSSSFERGGAQVDLSALKGGDKAAAQTADPKALRSETYTLADGTKLEIVLPSMEVAQALASIAGRIKPEHREAYEDRCNKMGEMVLKDVAENPEGLRVGKISAALTQEGATTYDQALVFQTQAEHEAAIQAAVGAPIVGLENNLHNFLAKHEAERQMGEEVRTDVAELRDMIAHWPEGGGTQSYTYREVVTDADGTKHLVEKTVTLTKEEAVALAEAQELLSNGLGSMTQIETVTLQVLVQVYNQSMTSFSNLMKAYEDNLRGIIQNAKAS